MNTPSAGVSGVRFTLLTPTGQQVWSCEHSSARPCRKAESWFVGEGSYTLTFAYRFEQSEHRAQQVFPARIGDELEVKLWFYAGYGASVEVPSWVSAELTVRRVYYSLKSPLQLIEDPRPIPKVRNVSDQPLEILSLNIERPTRDGKWESATWRCGTTPYLRNRANFLVGVGEEKVIDGQYYSAHPFPLIQYRNTVLSTWAVPTPERETPARSGIRASLEEQERFRQVFEYRM